MENIFIVIIAFLFGIPIGVLLGMSIELKRQANKKLSADELENQRLAQEARELQKSYKE